MLDSLDTLISFALIMLIVSLLITIVVQMASSALNLRGMNLANGLAETLETIMPGTQESAREFADYVLQSPLISDSSSKWFPVFWRRATAVRPDELFDAIHRIAIGRLSSPEQIRIYAQNLLAALGIDKKTLEDAAAALGSAGRTVDGIVSKANDALRYVPSSDLRQELKTALTGVTTQLQAYANKEADRIGQAAVSAAATVDDAYGKFRYWSNIGQERVQQWFAMHTRFLTVFFAVLFAFWLQLDTVEIYKLVSTNRAVRDKLVAQASTVASQADKILGDSGSVLEEALETLTAKQTDNDMIDALKSVAVEESDTRGSVGEKVNKAIAATPGKGRKLVGDWDSVVNETVKNRLGKQAGDFASVKSDLDHSGFELIPSGNSWRWGPEWKSNMSHHLAGILFSAALLSLGAPFWYNILKSLTSLRSTVAQNISDEKKQVRKQPGASSTGNAPPTVAPPQ
ncbi:MAG TPA: hypothetical protein VMJ66_12840 [Geobacteraceae bacterium]|nr:hypothetical protein [Geobacteraceae bacterium]